MKNNCLSKWLIFPFLFAGYFVTYFYFKNFFDSTLKGLLSIFFISFLVIFVIWLLAYHVFKNNQKSAVFVFIFLFFFLNFQNMINVLRVLAAESKNINLARFWLTNPGQRIVFGQILLILAFIFLIIKKIDRINPLIIFSLNLFSIVLLSGVFIRGYLDIHFYNNVDKNNFVKYWQSELDKNHLNIHPSYSVKPDIYYIILDGFGNSEVLNKLYGLDNSDFIQELWNRKFYIPNGSSTNYVQTRLSLASSLNMQYLDEIANIISEGNPYYYYPAYHMIDNSIIEQSLKNIGYDMVSFQAEVNFLDFSDWDVYYHKKNIPDSFTQTFFNTTGFSVFMNSQLYRWHYDSVNFVLESLPLTTNLQGPQFIFSHILCPHPPFIFTSDGILKKSDRLFTIHDANRYMATGTPEEYKLGYYDQVLFIQERILKTIDQIISSAKEPLIIIIQADHGPGMETNQLDIEGTNLKERFGILNAIYFYDENYEQLYQQISPVNTFRVVFDQYLGIDKSLLPDKHYYSNYTNLFDFTLVDTELE